MSDSTPRPWRVEHAEPYEPVLLGAHGESVKGVKLWEDDADYPGGDLNVVTRANARLVVQAVNAHDLLLQLAAQTQAILTRYLHPDGITCARVVAELLSLHDSPAVVELMKKAADK